MIEIKKLRKVLKELENYEFDYRKVDEYTSVPCVINGICKRFIFERLYEYFRSYGMRTDKSTKIAAVIINLFVYTEVLRFVAIDLKRNLETKVRYDYLKELLKHEAITGIDVINEIFWYERGEENDGNRGNGE